MAVVASGAAVLLIGRAVLAAVAGIADPPVWAGYATHARDFSHSVSAAGMLAGAILGYVLQERYVRFDTGGPRRQRLARFLIGFIGLTAILYGLNAVSHALGAPSPTSDDLLSLAARFFRYALAMFWAAYLAPWLFLKLRLATPRPPSA